MDEKMMPGQKPYTPEEREKKDRLLREAMEAEETIPLDELENYARTHCPHGKKLGECQECDVAGDLAFDAAREDSRRNF